MTDDIQLPWPKTHDVAFGRGSRPDLNYPAIALVERFLHNPCLTIHADAFREAADMIVQDIAEGRYPLSADKLFFPVAYLYRHAIELSLKEALDYAVRLQLITNNERLDEVLSEHALYPLWNKLKPAIEVFWPNADTGSLRATERIISQFHELDKTGQAFRYPTAKDGTPSLSKVPNPPKVVDMEQLKVVAPGLCNFIDGCTSGFMEAWSKMPHGEW
jgi:hypothetical protein